MVLEEPELHLPPAVQRRVLSRLQALSTQTIVTTHSPLIAAYCEAASLLVVRNDEGALAARPMLVRPLGQDATNAVRRLFQINRVETTAAMMNDFVLVPEGRLDFDWLVLLLRIAELERDSQRPCLFGARVGVVPTSDAKVKETCEALSKAHPRIVALVDGDAAGRDYANAIDEAGGHGQSIPYGDYLITPDAVGSWGSKHGAIGVSNGSIPDPKLRRDRDGIELHAATNSELETHGCVSIRKDQWPEFRKQVLTMVREAKWVYLHVSDRGASVSTNPFEFIGETIFGPTFSDVLSLLEGPGRKPPQ